MNNLITLITDFGIQDHYVGIMKGVITGISTECKIIDLTHSLEPQNIKQAAFILDISYKYFPKGTIFVVVVDPGVGSDRKAICVKTQDYYFLAPNNGVLSYCLQKQKIEKSIDINNPEFHLPDKSNTFHARDIFAPCAAHIANGIPIEKLGSELPENELIKCKPLKIIKSGNSIEGEIIYKDRFGNLITSIHESDIPKDKTKITLKIGEQEIKGISNTFSDVKKGELLAYIGSSGYLEIGIRDGRLDSDLSYSEIILHYH